MSEAVASCPRSGYAPARGLVEVAALVGALAAHRDVALDRGA